jgi:hypothetical protein
MEAHFLGHVAVEFFLAKEREEATDELDESHGGATQ